MATDIIARAMASNAMKGKGESYTKQESDARYLSNAGDGIVKSKYQGQYGVPRSAIYFNNKDNTKIVGYICGLSSESSGSTEDDSDILIHSLLRDVWIFSKRDVKISSDENASITASKEASLFSLKTIKQMAPEINIISDDIVLNSHTKNVIPTISSESKIKVSTTQLDFLGNVIYLGNDDVSSQSRFMFSSSKEIEINTPKKIILQTTTLGQGIEINAAGAILATANGGISINNTSNSNDTTFNVYGTGAFAIRSDQIKINSRTTNVTPTINGEDGLTLNIANGKLLTVSGFLINVNAQAPVTIDSPVCTLETKHNDAVVSKVITHSSGSEMEFKNYNNNNKTYSIKINNQGIILSTADSDRDIYLLTESIIEQANRIEWKKVPQSQSDDQHIYAEYMELNNVKTIDITSNNQLRVTSSIGIALVSPYLTINNNPVLPTILLTQTEYDALTTKDPNVVYNIYEPDEEEGE